GTDSLACSKGAARVGLSMIAHAGVSRNACSTRACTARIASQPAPYEARASSRIWDARPRDSLKRRLAARAPNSVRRAFRVAKLVFDMMSSEQVASAGLPTGSGTRRSAAVKARRRRLASAEQPRAGLDGENCRVPWEDTASP